MTVHLTWHAWEDDTGQALPGTVMIYTDEKSSKHAKVGTSKDGLQETKQACFPGELGGH